MYYCDVDFYRYYVGRPNQSVTLQNVGKNYRMSIRVYFETVIRYSYEELKALPRKQYKYMIHDLFIKAFLTQFHVMAVPSKEKDQHFKIFWKYFKEHSRKLYNKVVFRTPFVIMLFMIPPVKRWAVKFGYKQMIKKTKWN
jgi:hypothetical protein